MDQRVNMIMTGAENLAELRKFYETGLGWSPWMAASHHSITYRVGHSILVFIDKDYLAQERGVPLSRGSKTSLAVFVASKSSVDDIYAQAVAAGATTTSATRHRDGGLYSGYFADPEGNSWEIVWSPSLGLDINGALTLPEK
jgi:predicted lactoylglutathione lyase